MTRDELFARLLQATSHDWHWWSFHFQSDARGRRVPFVDALIDALLEIDAVMPGYAARTAETIGTIAGRERHQPHYEQLLQRLAEIHVARQTVGAGWPEGTSFADEPVAPGSALNPELVIHTDDFRLGIEVKAPSLLAHEAQRSTRPLQGGGRILPPDRLAQMAGGRDQLTLPRDNPVKDFLISANDKFAAFHAVDPDFFGALAIVWDDFIYEPITALIHPASGLLTDSSFARDDDGVVMRFEHVDAILLISHLQYLKWALAEDGTTRPFQFSHQAFRWNIDAARPVTYVDTPHGHTLPAQVPTLLELLPLGEMQGAEYQPQDWIGWINTRNREPGGETS
jgi:hypothetical protein